MDAPSPNVAEAKALPGELQALSMQSAKLEKQKSRLEERLKTALDELDEADSQRNALERKAKRLEGDYNRLKVLHDEEVQARKSLQVQCFSAEGDISALRAELERAQKSTSLSAFSGGEEKKLKHSLDRLEYRLANEVSERRIAEQQKATLDKKVNDLQQLILKADRTKTELSSALDNRTSQLREVMTKLEHLEKRNLQLEMKQNAEADKLKERLEEELKGATNRNKSNSENTRIRIQDLGDELSRQEQQNDKLRKAKLHVDRENMLLKQECKEASDKANHALQHLEKADHDARMAKQEFTKEIDQLQTEQSELVAVKTRLENHVSVLSEQLSQMKENVSALKGERQKLQGQVKKLTAQLKTERTERDVVTTQLHNTEKELSDLRKRAKKADELMTADEQAKHLQQLLEEEEKKNESIKDTWKGKMAHQASEFNQQLDTKARKFDALAGKAETLTTHLRVTERQLKQAELRLEEAETNNRLLKEELTRSKQILGETVDAKEKLDKTDYELESKKLQLDECKVEIEALKAKVKALVSKVDLERECAERDRAFRIRLEKQTDLLQRDLHKAQGDLEQALVQVASAQAAARSATDGDTAATGGEASSLSQAERDRLNALARKLKEKLKEAKKGLNDALDENMDLTNVKRRLEVDVESISKELERVKKEYTDEATAARMAESKLNSMESNLDQLKSQLSKINSEKLALQARVDNAEQEITESQREAEKNLREVREEKAKALDTVDYLEGKSEELKRAVKRLEDTVERLQERLHSRDSSDDSNEAQLKSLVADRNRAEAEADVSRREARDLNSRVRKLQSQVQKANDKAAEALQERDEVEVDAKSYKRQFEACKTELEDVKRTAQESQRMLTRLQADSDIAKELQHEVSLLDERRRALSDEVQSLTRQMADLEDERDKAVRKAKNLTLDYEEAQSDVDRQVARADKLEASRDKLSKQMVEQAERYSQLSKKCDVAEREAQDAKLDALAYQRQAEDFRQMADTLKARLSDTKRERGHDIRELEADNDRLAEKLREADIKNARVSDQAQQLEEELTQVQRKLANTRDNATDLSEDLKEELKDMTEELKREKQLRVTAESELFRAQSDLENAQNKAKTARREAERLRSDYDVATENMNEQLVVLRRNLRKAEEARMEAISEAGKAGSKDLLLQREIQKLNRQLERTEESASGFEEQSKKQAVEIRKLRDQVEYAEEEKDELVMKLKRATSRSSISDLSSFTERLDRSSALQKELAVMRVDRDNYKAEMNQLKFKYENEVRSKEEKLKDAELDIRERVREELEEEKRKAEEAEAARIAALPPPIKARERLVIIKGDDYIQARLTELSSRSLSRDDVFLLDLGPKLFLWNGANANNKKRTKGHNVATRMVKQRGGRAELVIVEDGKEEAPEEFWVPLGGKPDSILAASPEDDKSFQQKWVKETMLYRINPGYKLFRIPGPLTRTKLQPGFGYILDAQTEVYIWLGSEVASDTVKGILKKGKLVFQNKQRPPWSVLKKQRQDKEDVLFKEKFLQWKAPALRKKGLKTSRVEKKDTKEAVLEEYDRKYTYAQLIAGEFPDSVDTDSLEVYLADSEFELIFKTTREEFSKLSKWKQAQAKKRVNLF